MERAGRQRLRCGDATGDRVDQGSIGRDNVLPRRKTMRRTAQHTPAGCRGRGDTSLDGSVTERAPVRVRALPVALRVLPEPGLALRAPRPVLRPGPVPGRSSDCMLPAGWPSRAQQEFLETSFGDSYAGKNESKIRDKGLLSNRDADQTQRSNVQLAQNRNMVRGLFPPSNLSFYGATDEPVGCLRR